MRVYALTKLGKKTARRIDDADGVEQLVLQAGLEDKTFTVESLSESIDRPKFKVASSLEGLKRQGLVVELTEGPSEPRDET